MKGIYILGIFLLVTVIGGIYVLLNTGSDLPALTAEEYEVRPYQEIVNPSGFVNTDNQPIQIADYIGKRVILLDIMTYSCINCVRTFPYVTGWYEKYKDDGFIVIGIHTPEFAFEKDKTNVEDAMKKFGINFPVVLDNQYGTWNALGNRYWPRKYLIDIQGNIVYDHIGEGAYEQTEKKIQQLLLERAKVLGEADITFDTSLVTELVSEVKINAKSPETYFGSARNEYLANGESGKKGMQSFVFPDLLVGNKLYLGGEWNITNESAVSSKESVLKYKYNAQNVYLVASAEDAVRIEVWQDGELVSADAGEDVKDGSFSVQESRLYKVIQNSEPGEHMLELRVMGEGVELFAFTFG